MEPDNDECDQAAATPPPKRRGWTDRWAAGFAALSVPEFRVLWAATFANSLGGWVYKVATAWLIYELSGSAFYLGLDAAVSGLATALLLPWAGVLADRTDRRSLLMWVHLFSIIPIGALAVLGFLNQLTVWTILTASFLLGVGRAVALPSTQSLLPNLVGEAQLSNAVALNSLQFNVARIAGPALGGLVLTTAGAPWSFMIYAVSALLLVGALVRIRPIPPKEVPAESVWRNLAKGCRYLARHERVLTMLGLVVVTAFGTAPVVSMLPALVDELFAGGATEYSLLLGAFGGGAAIGALIMALRSDQAPRPWRAFFFMTIVAGCELGLCIGGWYWLATVFVAGVGLCLVATMVGLGAGVLHATDDAYRGRVMSFHTLAFRAGQPLGSMLAGGLIALWGVRPTLALYALLIMLSLTALLLAGRIYTRIL